jgi:hypothetical protein
VAAHGRGSPTTRTTSVLSRSLVVVRAATYAARRALTFSEGYSLLRPRCVVCVCASWVTQRASSSVRR